VSTPTIEEGPGCFRFRWSEEQVEIVVSRILQEKGGTVRGLVKISTWAPGFAPHLNRCILNLTSSRCRSELARDLAEGLEVDWRGLLEQLCFHTMERVWAGEPSLTLSTREKFASPECLIRPLMPKNQPTVLFGLGGTGKSSLSLVLATVAALPWFRNPLGLWAPEEPAKVLYVDYETDESDIGWRLGSLQRGMGLRDFEIDYRRGVLPLADDVEQLQQLVFEKGTGLLIVDSVGGACGSDLNTPDTAIRFFSALRHLHVTSLVIAHTSKNSGGREATPFGSAFFTNFARSVWEVRKQQEEGSDTLHVELHHRKANQTEMHRPMGFWIRHQEDRIMVGREEVVKKEKAAENDTFRERLIRMMGEREWTTAELEAATGAKLTTIRGTLGRLKESELAVKTGDRWRLVL
jgi:hypothetical protein